jgi:hypothetical protein
LRVSGFAVGRICIQPFSWGATDINVSIDSNNTGTLFYNAMESYRMIGGQVIVNSIGHRTGGDGTAGGVASCFAGVSFDSNNKYGFIESAGNGQTATFTGCHFENFNLSTALPCRYIRTQTASVSIEGGDAIDDQSAGSTDYWFSVAFGPSGALGGVAALSVSGLQISGSRNPSSAVFKVGGRGTLNGSNASSSTITHVYVDSTTGTVTSFFQNAANSVTEAAMEISGNLTLDGTLAVAGALVPFTPVSTGFTVTGSPTYTGQYQKIGKLVWWQIQVTQHSGSTIACTLGTSSFAVPVETPAVTVPFSVTDLVSVNGIGVVVAGSTIQPPTFSATGNAVYLSGTYITN